jgi:butyrate kinase
MEELRILAINPGSTSTKIAVFSGANPVFVRTITHSAEELSKYDKMTDQYAFRKAIIYKQLEEAGIEMDSIRAVVGRGGLRRL